MLRIGEFSRITGISIYMLRNYDKMGLMVPRYVDEESGYRYYGENQIPIANQIQVLKALGFGLKEIGEIQLEDAKENERPTQKTEIFLLNKIQEKNDEINKIHEQIKQMKEAYEEIRKQEQYALSVTIKEIPARKVICLRDHIHAFEEEGRLWEELNKYVQEKAIRLAQPQYSYAITHRVNFRRMDIDVEVQLEVEKMGEDCKKVFFEEIPACEAATIAFEGVYSKFSEVNSYMRQWVYRNGYELAGKTFTRYYLSPGNEPNPENFITEVFYPVKKRNL
ncbi:MerR family transcriptional regulator [Anaerosporobacter faecicola]|uniref:MerR family transcriptional regulator n=1 Tax=Anaerosporobacter faecicola TaxID=2718714 RepID=UPI00143985ED|nr:MerR family transcriptional regulator [Anaerosporobacter faecicola]